jgi:hypothetical protein
MLTPTPAIVPTALANPRTRRSLRHRLARGQAMIEYSVVSHALLIGGGGTLIGVAHYLQLFSALDTYLKSVYTVLAMGGV